MIHTNKPSYYYTTDECKSDFQLRPDFPSRKTNESAEELLFQSTYSIKEAWERQARQKAWKEKDLIDGRYVGPS
jgi:hypothetical protein